MREFELMTHKEKISLNSGDINRLCDYECAKNGVKLMDLPIEPQKKVFKADATVYKALDYYTEDKEIAEKIVLFFAEIRQHLCKVDYEWKHGSENKYIRRNLDDYDYRPEVKQEQVFNTETYNKLKDEMREYNDKKAQYDGELKAYKENDEKRAKETDWIREDISAHVRLEDKFFEYQKQWSRYVDLANGDQVVALNFFRKSLTEEELGPVAEYIEARLAGNFEDENQETEMCEKAVNEIRSYW